MQPFVTFIFGSDGYHWGKKLGTKIGFGTLYFRLIFFLSEIVLFVGCVVVSPSFCS